MNGQFLFDGQERTRFFTVEDHGRFTLVRFGPHVPEHLTNLSKARQLQEVLTGSGGALKKVLLITSTPGSLSPASMDQFWNYIQNDQAKRSLSPAKDLADVKLAREENAFKHFVEIVRKMDSFVIAAIGGECDFAFLGVTLACDYRIAAHDTVFINRLFTSEATAGVLPWFLSRFLGHAQATDILLEGRSLTAIEAYELKLVNTIAPPGNLEQISLDIATRFAAIPASTLRAIKRGLVASVENLGVYLDQIGTGFQHVKGPPATGTR